MKQRNGWVARDQDRGGGADPSQEPAKPKERIRSLTIPGLSRQTMQHDRAKKQRYERFGMQENDHKVRRKQRYGNRQNRNRIARNCGRL